MRTLRPFTIGYDARMSTVMVDGKAGGISFGRDVILDRLFLFGKPIGPAWSTHSFAFGQGPTEAQQALRGFIIRVNNGIVRGGHFSTELVAAHSKVVEVYALVEELLSKTTGPNAGDVYVTTVMLLDKLMKNGLPNIGYPLTPPIALGEQDYIQVDGLQEGERLYLTGQCLAEVQ